MWHFKYGFLITLIIIFFSSCKKDNPTPETLKINTWIYNSMSQFYLWNNTISETENLPTNNKQPDEYFKSLLNKPTDKWSTIIDNYTEFNQSSEGNPTGMGYKSVYGTFNNSGNVFAIVKFVYPETPAYIAGLKRGDVIIKVNNTNLTKENFQELFDKDSYTVTLGQYIDGSVRETDTEISMTAVTNDINPIINETIFHVENKTIGYFALTDFIEYESFKTKVTPTLQNFKTHNINELIIDLRYNLGGDLLSAIWLASTLAPLNNTLNHDVFVKLVYNDYLQPIKEDNNQTEMGFEYLPDLNLGINNIYFLTTNYSTASASELTICGLKPYMNVTQVGDSTIGKYHGMWVLPHSNKVWAILPVVFKYANANNFTDFSDGLIPDHYVEDKLIDGYALGDKNDPVVALALEHITGLPLRKSTGKAINFDYLFSTKQKQKMNLFVKQSR